MTTMNTLLLQKEVDSMQDNTSDVTREIRTIGQSQMKDWEIGNKDVDEPCSFPSPHMAKGRYHSALATFSKKVHLPSNHFIASLTQSPWLFDFSCLC